jgi:hypothetical protein
MCDSENTGILYAHFRLKVSLKMKRTKTSSSLYLFHSPCITDYFQTMAILNICTLQCTVYNTCTSPHLVQRCNGTVKYRAVWVCWN